MSKLILFGPTALEYYSTCNKFNFRALPLSDSQAASFRPVKGSGEFLESRFPLLSKPYRVAVFRNDDRRVLKDIRCNIASPSAQASPHYLIADGILVPPPELAFLQACRSAEVVAAVVAGSQLCSAFTFEACAGKLAERSCVTSPKRIEEASLWHRDVPGRLTARKAIPWIVPHARSPREVALALTLMLPGGLGGYGLPRPLLNHPIELPNRMRGIAAKSYYVADLCWPEQRLVMEYDSDACHLTSEQLYLDAVKRMTLDSMGYRVISITRLQLNEPQAMNKVAQATASALGTQLRFRAHGFPAKQNALWAALGLSRAQ